jgi:hypothetical protein
MAALSFALGGRGQNRGAGPDARVRLRILWQARILRACVRLILRCAGTGPRVLARLCLRDELPAVAGRSYWRVVLDFVACW